MLSISIPALNVNILTHPKHVVMLIWLQGYCSSNSKPIPVRSLADRMYELSFITNNNSSAIWPGLLCCGVL